jgi:hypothetical protein
MKHKAPEAGSASIFRQWVQQQVFPCLKTKAEPASRKARVVTKL